MLLNSRILESTISQVRIDESDSRNVKFGC